MSGADRAEELDRLSEEFVRRVREGGGASVSEYAARHPELAQEIRRLFPLLLGMEGLKEGIADDHPPVDTVLGEFRIVREIGRGGMGVVYEAVQGTLDRRVALKVLPSSATRDRRFLERFRLEARAAGRLQHPNVVPVIGIGEHDGIHYFAMQYIDGRGLDQLVGAVRELLARPAEAPDRPEDGLVRRLLSTPLADASSGGGSAPGARRTPAPTAGRPLVGRTWFDNAVRLVLQAAEGVAAAHARGVLHRDIKPSNLLVDEDARVWITDFGLCKEEEGAADLTRPGDMLGTLRYMPPERLHGESDVQGDVYGLGITLYELLTLRPAYPRDDPTRILAALAKDAPPRPRRQDPRIPRDLEAIVLKAVARERRERYATAEAFASDLRAWLDGRPIAARPPSLAVHLRGAIRRHRPLAITLLLASLALVASSVFYVVNLKRKEADARFASYVANVAAAEAALDTGDVAGARRLLHDAAPEWRGWEWHYLQGRLDPSLRTTHLDGATARAVSYAPDGRFLAVAAGDGVRIFDDEHGREHRRLATGPGTTRVRWSPRGDRIAVSTTEGLELWSWPDAGRESAWTDLGRWPIPAWSRDGRRLAVGGEDGMLRVWRVGEEAPFAVLPVHTIVQSLDCDATGARVVTGGWDGRATMWDVERGERVWSSHAGRHGLHGIAFLGEDLVATPSEAQHAQIWDARDGRHVRTLSRRGNQGVIDVRSSPDGQHLVVGTNDSVGVYEVGSWEPGVTWSDGSGVRDVAVHPSGLRVATVSVGSDVREWSIADGADPSVLRGHIDDVSDVAYAPSGDWLVSAGIGGVVRRWDARTGEELRVWIGHRWTVLRLAVSPDGRTVAASDRKGDVLLWDVETDEVGRRLGGHGDGALGLDFSPDGARLYAADLGGALHAWDLERNERAARIQASPDGLTALAVDPRGRWVVTGDAAGHLQFWDPHSLDARGELTAHDGEVARLAFDRTGDRLASCSYDGTLKVWDAGARTPLHVMRGGILHGIAFSPDGRRLAGSARDGNVRLWDTESGRLVLTHGRLTWVNAVTFSPDGRQLAAGEGGSTVRVWDVRPLRERVPRVDPLADAREPARVLVASLRSEHESADAVIAAIRARADLDPDLREAALRLAYRWRGTEDELVAFLWRVVTPRRLGERERWVGRGLAADLARAAGHRNRQDRRRLTLWAALTLRCGDLDLASDRIRRAMSFDEEEEPYLFAVDLAFLVMTQVGLKRTEEAAGTLARLEAHLAGHPGIEDARLAGFVAEAREAVEGGR